MGQAKNRKAEINQLKAQNTKKAVNPQEERFNKVRNKFVPTPSKTTKYGKLVKTAKGCDGSTVSIYRANQLSLDNYKLATGFLPYEIEFAEAMGLQIDDSIMNQMFGITRDSEFELGSWRDHLLVITRDGKDYAYGFRVHSDNKDKVFQRPAYNDTKVLTALEAGLTRMAIIGSHLSQYAFWHGEGPNDYLRTGAMSGIGGQEVGEWAEAAKIAADAFRMVNVFSILD